MTPVAGRTGTRVAGDGPRKVRAFRHRPVAYTVMAAYAVLSTVLMVRHDVGVTSEHALLLAIVVAAAVAPARGFVWDWLPFLFVGVMFEDLTPVASRFLGTAHLTAPINFEKSLLGGQIAAVWLQRAVGTAAGLRWFDVALSIEYLLHFAAPILAGVWLWRRHRARFGTFVTAYVMVMAIGFAIYLVYPEVPPWLASRRMAFTGLDRVVVDLLNSVRAGLGTAYAGADPEPNGAMPALHASIPVLVAATWWSVHGWRAPSSWLWLLYPLTVSFATVYLGEHYVADVAVGLLVGLAGFALARVANVRRIAGAVVVQRPAASGPADTEAAPTRAGPHTRNRPRVAVKRDVASLGHAVRRDGASAAAVTPRRAAGAARAPRHGR